ncbi:TOTE conflict system archaeo-eukaryotic primase domain-containing protein [Priestia megaterium]|uniref:TOTE conflict system archaeo-eukaryotic primase domain-containing protein n=1 Tax=Priestia megaterium TaxID=1404 RepID=UPI000CA201FB|nr:hypothetical protein [Priestia megaterium]AUO12207.1 hypothetical protein C0569_13190 [Priestia megaterium]
MVKVKKQIIEDILVHMNKILIRTRTMFIEQYKNKNGTVNWVQRKYMLTDNVVRSHLKGRRTVGIYYFGDASVFLFFDIDAEGDEKGQKLRVREIIAVLKSYGIEEKDVHVMFSGSKGYHVQLFFDKPIPIKRIAAFGRKVLNHLGSLGKGIELRPENINGRGVKLPLAYHKKTESFAYYVEKEKLEPVKDSLIYFLNVVPFSHKVIEDACDKALNKEIKNSLPDFKEDELLHNENCKRNSIGEMKLVFNTKYSLEERAKELLEKGLKRKGLRHQSQFILALYYKGQGKSFNIAVENISNWVTQQWENKKTNESSLEFLKLEVERNVKYIYKKEKYKGLFSNRGRELIISYQDINFVAQHERKNVRKVLLALLIIGKIYHVEGVFSADMKSIGEISGFSRQTVSIILKELVNYGIIERVSDYVYSEGLARTYCMLYLKKDSTKNKGIIKLDNLTLSQSFERLIELVERSV